MTYHEGRLIAVSGVFLVALIAMVGCGNSSVSTTTTAPPLTVPLTLVPTSGTPDAVNPDSLLSVVIPASAGIVDPLSVRVSLSPSVLFTAVNVFSGSVFANTIDIIPSGFLPQATPFSVTTNFLVIRNNTVYSVTSYNFFTTASITTPFPAVPGDGYLLTMNTLSQSQGLMPLITGTMPAVAISVLTATVSSNPTATGADGSVLLYGGRAFSDAAPSDIDPAGFAMPVAASYQGNEFIASGSAIIPVSGTTVPLVSFSLRGTLNTDGTLSGGVFYGLIHCADASCSNITDTTIAQDLSPFVNTNNDIVVLGTVNGVANPVTSGNWITAGDTVQTNLADGVGAGISTATLEITTTSSPLTTTATLPFIILAQTDANNMIHISAIGQSSDAVPLSSPMTFDYPLIEPGLPGLPFSTAAGVTCTAYFMFGLTNFTTVTFTP